MTFLVVHLGCLRPYSSIGSSYLLVFEYVVSYAK